MNMSSKKNKHTREIIPFDLVITILTKLPAKSLMRVKSVSNRWSTLICSQYFTKLFLKASSSSPHPHIYMTLDFDNKDFKNSLVSLSPSPDSDGTTMTSSYVFDQDLSIPGLRGYIAHVFRGLMCFVDGPSAQIYNTTTRQLVLLPKIEESKIIHDDQKEKKIMYHIGHDPVYDQYKVFCAVGVVCKEEVGDVKYFMSEHWVLSLGGDGSSRWRKITSPCPPHLPIEQGLTINGRTHYLAWVRVPDPVLVSFDINSEEISMLQVHEVHENIFYPFIDLVEYDGKVAILNHQHLEEEGKMELWVMEDVERNRWSMKTLDLYSQVHLVKSISLSIQGTTRDGEVVFAPTDAPCFYILLYDFGNNHMRKVELRGTPNRHITKSNEVIVGLDDTENIMYIKAYKFMCPPFFFN